MCQQWQLFAKVATAGNKAVDPCTPPVGQECPWDNHPDRGVCDLTSHALGIHPGLGDSSNVSSRSLGTSSSSNTRNIVLSEAHLGTGELFLRGHRLGVGQARRPGRQRTRRIHQRVTLFAGRPHGCPLWERSPSFGRRVDMVCLPSQLNVA
jgi:hypothetical protein